MITIQTIIDIHTDNMTPFFQSIAPLNPQILVANMGASRECVQLCEENNSEVYRLYGTDSLGNIRNQLSEKGTHKYQMFMHPWEEIIHGWDQIKNLDQRAYNVSIINGNLLSKETRIWNTNTGIKFINPVCEHLNEKTENYRHCVISSTHEYDTNDRLNLILKWKGEDIKNPDPYYYLSLCYLTLGKYAEFLKVSSHYMHLNPKRSISSTMHRYYFALVNLQITKQYKPALQSITQCLEFNPLMAEFWCLAGDVHYHLLKGYDKARALYENAIILGSRRTQNDPWPMDISKYQEYPEKMIKSCDGIIQNKSYFVK